MNKKILIGSIITIVILTLASSSLAVIAYTAEKTPFASTESFAVLGNLPRWEEEIRYYNPETLIHVIGVGCGPLYWMSAIRLTPDELAPYQGWNLSKITVATSIESEQTEIWANLTIYAQGTQTTPGPIIYQDNGLYFNTTGFQIIPLQEPISLNDHSELWIAFEWFESVPGAYLIQCDDGPAVDGKGDWVNLGSGWDEIQGVGLDYNWGMGAIVEGEGKAELSIINIKGPIGVNAEVKNIGEVTAYNVEYTMTVTGGILGRISRIVSDTITELAPGETVPMNSGLIIGFSPIDTRVRATASNAYEVYTLKTGFILGPFVFGIR